MSMTIEQLRSFVTHWEKVADVARERADYAARCLQHARAVLAEAIRQEQDA